ncbi:Zinc transporter 5 [Micractinium conductrix]|uniref:Zinc transporter 5 n=1 Tax=Micractinium conductrix TaxID=554055 RepID=A0A2P6VDE8_9CHLO|nr:Zinc transporter 5 [Micractinium conductrix]|eukprot:PSC72115.1 Zinc transporter 5 [Micractinium conductrix]
MGVPKAAAAVLLACLLCARVCAVAAATPSATAAAPAAEDHDDEGEHAEAPALVDDHSDEHEEHEGEPAAAPAEDDHARKDDEHAHDHEEEGGSESEHAHGVDAMGLAELSAELGSVQAAKDELCNAIALEGYNLGLHIGSIFILLGVSALGAGLPVLLHISSKSSFVLAVVKMGTYFGFGTILATAFIHMLLPANKNLSSPCLPESWNERYEAWAYLFVVLAIVFMQLIDYLIEGAYQRYLERRGGQPHTAACHEQATDDDLHNHHAAVVGAIASIHKSKANLAAPDVEAAHAHAHAHGQGCLHPHDSTGSGSDTSGKPSDVEAGTAAPGAAGEDGVPCAVHGEGCASLITGEPGHTHKTDPSHIVGIYLMEAGIIFHSVLIGITLGVTTGSAFRTLLVALAFHQFFEGFAIGAAVVDSGLGVMKSLLMGMAYAVTTPIGIAVGIGMRESFNQNAETTLLTEGIFDSISTGILIYVVLVELINPLMTQSAWLRSRRWWVQMLAFASFYAGVTVMAVIGKWA